MVLTGKPQSGIAINQSASHEVIAMEAVVGRSKGHSYLLHLTSY